jgi:hypothetical protein
VHIGFSRAIPRTQACTLRLEGDDDLYSARIGLDYRALAVMRKDRLVWYWIGSHSDYDRLI